MTEPNAPSAAERARSVLARAGSAELVWLDENPGPPATVHRIVLDADADPEEWGRPACIEVADPAPLPVRDRIRARVRLYGQARDDQGVLRIRPTAVRLVEQSQTYAVSLHGFRQASPDPLACCEGPFLSHLAAEHPGLLENLTELVDPSLRAGVSRARPVQLDRYGLVLRLEDDFGHRDVRLAFGHPLDSADELRSAMRELAARATARRPLGSLFRAGPAAARICSPDPE